jgi:hypothetical protein
VNPKNIPGAVCATQETEADVLRKAFQSAHRACEQAAYAWACAADLGRERERAFEIYENIRTATRIAA